MKSQNDKSGGISLLPLTAMVVTSAIGSGIFALTSDLAKAAAPGPVLIAWLIVGIGIMALALSLNNLVIKRPDLSGVFDYAEAGFGQYAGFISGWGYWLSCWLGNVAFATVMMSSIGYFIPVFKPGNNWQSILLASIISWILTLVVCHGIESATILNFFITICKLIPLFTFIIFAIILFKLPIFTHHFWYNISGNFNHRHDIGLQVKNCMMVLMWLFVGIEGAANMSSRANRKSDAGKATILGLICLLTIYILASVLPYGYLTQEQLAKMNQPAMVYIFKSMVGNWGGALISIGLVLSTMGSWFSWTILPAETVMLMSNRKLLPEKLGYKNKHGSPTIALIISGLLVQLFLISLLFTQSAYHFAYSLCTAAIVISYILTAAYQIKYSWDNIKQPGNIIQLAIGVIALVFECVGIYMAGFQYVLLCFIAYIPGFFLFAKARQESGQSKIFNKTEILITILICLGALIGVILLVSKKISL